MNGVIDAHSRLGPGRPHERRSADEALREMDALGVERSWISPCDAFAAVLNKEGNDFIADAVAAHPDRFVGCAVANPWRGAAAVEELLRAFDRGLRVLVLHPAVQGCSLSDELLDPLVDVAVEFRAPIYAHTGTPICGMPLQLAALARRHPAGRFVMGHMGYSDFWYDVIPAAEISSNIVLETSFALGDFVPQITQRLGDERIVFGSASPLSSLVVEVAKMDDLSLPESSRKRIMRENAQRLML